MSVNINIPQLRVTLAKLNGLQDDHATVERICQDAVMYGNVAIFAYGSLIWEPIKHVSEKITNYKLAGYSKDFICEDFIYRGTIGFPGLTLALKNDSNKHVLGFLLMSTADEIIPFLEGFILREQPVSIDGVTMDIYRYDFLPITRPDGSTRNALTCVVNEHSQFYVNPPLPLNQKVARMALAFGDNGTNLQYLKNLISKYDEHKLYDKCTDELKDLLNKCNDYRLTLSPAHREWLEGYDTFQSSQDRQIYRNTYQGNGLPTNEELTTMMNEA